MHIAVVLRVVPDLSDELEIDDTGADIDSEWIGLKLNEFDDHALEEAILLQEASGARVTAVALDGEGAERQLQMAIARGANDALLVEHDIEGNINSRLTADLLAPVITELKADIVFTGVQTSEDVFGQLAPFLAGVIGWPTINAVHGVTVDGDRLVVTQEYSGGHAASFTVAGQAVLGIQTASKPPRYVSGSKLRQASSAEIAKASAAASDAALIQKSTALSEPESGSRAEMIGGSAEAVAEEIVKRLAERGLVGGQA